MRVKTVAVGMEVRDKIDGAEYKVTSVVTEDGTPISATLTEILNNDEEREPKTLTIDGKNDRTFQVTKWVKDTTIPTGFTVRDGRLMQNDRPVTEMGDIVAKEIIRTFPGAVLFSAGKTGDETTDFVQYIPSRDKFVRLLSLDIKGAKTPVTIESSMTREIIGYNMYEQVEEEDPKTGDVTKKEVYDHTEILVFTDDMGSSEYLEEEVDLESGVLDESGRNLYIRKTDPDDSSYIRVRVTNTALYQEDKVDLPAGLLFITKNHAVKGLGDEVYAGDGFIQIGDDRGTRVCGKNIAEMVNDGYIHLVDLQKDDSNNRTFFFANLDRSIRKVSQRRTKDRGVIVTVD